MASKNYNYRCCLKSLQLSKGIGKLADESANKINWNILKEEISLPALVLDYEKFIYNLNWMEDFLKQFETKNKILIAPHGKTTMMPSLFKEVCGRQSSWGMTVASASQTKVAHTFGTTNILMANQLVGKRNMEIVSEIMKDDPVFEFLCIIDSEENVNQLGRFFSERKQTLKVLLEYGPQNGRTGVRSVAQEKEIISTLKTWNETIKLVGIEFFEGVLQLEEEIRNFIQFVTSRAKYLLNSRVFDVDDISHPVILTGSGSSWFDIVAEKLTEFVKENEETYPLQIILRPGCYMIHDVGLYQNISSRMQAKGLTTLKPALKIWAYVQSIPEKDLAILSFGKRDGADDCGFPKPAFHFRPGPEKESLQFNVEANKEWTVFRMMDQHSFMRIKENDDIVVGDIVVLDIKHPCTTLDKWRNILVMDNALDCNVVDVIPTFF